MVSEMHMVFDGTDAGIRVHRMVFTQLLLLQFILYLCLYCCILSGPFDSDLVLKLFIFNNVQESFINYVNCSLDFKFGFQFTGTKIFCCRLTHKKVLYKSFNLCHYYILINTNSFFIQIYINLSKRPQGTCFTWQGRHLMTSKSK